jgi:hypothetical protein
MVMLCESVNRILLVHEKISGRNLLFINLLVLDDTGNLLTSGTSLLDFVELLLRHILLW